MTSLVIIQMNKRNYPFEWVVDSIADGGRAGRVRAERIYERTVNSSFDSAYTVVKLATGA